MSRMTRIAEALAQGISMGPMTPAAVAGVFRSVLGRDYSFASGVVTRLLTALGTIGRVRRYLVQRFILGDPAFKNACAKHAFNGLSLLAINGKEPDMIPLPGAAAEWQVPAIVTTGDLARWLGIKMPVLLWLADARTTEARVPAGPLRRYHYRWQLKRHGGARLIESPKPRLKSLQRRILHGILDAIPPHPAAHGFRRGHSTVSFAAPHVNQSMVLRMDLEDFFPRLPRWRVLAIFMTAGYPEPVATMLANICVNTTPGSVLLECPASLPLEQRWALRKLYLRPHPTQGSPASPALANLCAYRLDLRLSGLARAAGVCYTRYADDLVFSGGDGFARSVERFYIKAAAIAMEEGFRPNTRKTKFMARSDSQRAAGIVVNEKINVPREDFDTLKAILHNCVVHGPKSQDRAQHAAFPAHLAGRIAQVRHVNPARGEKLGRIFDRIDWSR